MISLDQQLLAAHEDNDMALLVELYQQAAEQASDDEAKYFYMTHAYIFALDTNHPDIPALKSALVAAGRES